MTNFGSSKYMGAVNFTGILSNDHTENPGIESWFCHGFPTVSIKMLLLGHVRQ
jgi:hypothetical protein